MSSPTPALPGLSCLTAFGVPFVMFTQHKHAAEKMTAAWLLPIVPLITAASVGSTMCKLLLAQDRISYCMTILIGSYLCAGIGMLLAMAIIVLYFQRLVLHHLPPREVIVSSWLPVGPIGQGGYALIELVSPLRAHGEQTGRDSRLPTPRRNDWGSRRASSRTTSSRGTRHCTPTSRT